MMVLLKIVGFFSSPIGMIVAGFLALTGYVLYQRHDAVQDERAKVETRKVEDVKKANTARNTVRSACERDASKCLRDDWFRD